MTTSVLGSSLALLMRAMISLMDWTVPFLQKQKKPSVRKWIRQHDAMVIEAEQREVCTS
jgi:hypothetical protein